MVVRSRFGALALAMVLGFSVSSLTGAAPRKKKARHEAKEAKADSWSVVERLVIADGVRDGVPQVTVRTGQVTAIHTHSPIRRFAFGDDTCVEQRENDPNTPTNTAYLIGARPCAKQSVWVETAEGLTEVDLKTVSSGVFTREVRIASAKAENTLANMRAEVQSQQVQIAKLRDDLRNAEAAAQESVKLVPAARAEGYKEGEQNALRSGLSALSATSEKARKSPHPIVSTKEAKITQLGVWTTTDAGLWARYIVENRTTQNLQLLAEVEGARVMMGGTAGSTTIGPRAKQVVAVFVERVERERESAKGEHIAGIPAVRFVVSSDEQLVAH